MKNNISDNHIFQYYKAYADLENEKGTKGKSNPFSIAWFYEGIEKGEIKYTPLLPIMLGENGDDLCKVENIPDHSKYLIDKNLNESQSKAIRTALSHPLTVIEGPPGTGKTKTIVNLMSAIMGLGKTVAMVSFNSEAVGNVSDKIEDLETAPVGSPAQKLYHGYARLGNVDMRKKFYYTDACMDYRKSHPYEEDEKPDHKSFLKHFPAITSTIHSLRRLFADSKDCLFDYVIMDESSQTRPDLGMIAASCARHLILVGDAEQLPSFCDRELLGDIGEKEKKLIGNEACYRYLRDVGGRMDDNSFFDIARHILSRFGEKAPSVMLNVHYRCHPKIIQFCNQYVYGGRMMIGKTEEPCPIRVRYFNGDYDERCFRFSFSDRNMENKEPVGESHHNLRQIAVWKDEEMDGVFEKLLNDESVCILTPYRGQLEEIRYALYDEATRRLSDPALLKKDRERISDLRDYLSDDDLFNEGYGEKKEGVFDKCVLTVHKSQGKEYDTVYLLPVEDGNWMWPWSHSKRLINVAVSRAKKELVIVASTALMSEELQRNLGIKHPTKRRENPELRALSDSEGFLQKLLDYTWDQCQGQSGDYGFMPSKQVSVFDEKPLIQEWSEGDDNDDKLLKNQSYRNDNTSISCEELAAYMGLKTACDGYKVWYEVPIKTLFEDYEERIENIPDQKLSFDTGSFEREELREYIENNASCDLVILDSDNVIQCTIEIQGAPHRAVDRYDGQRGMESCEERYEHVKATQRNDRLKALIIGGFLGSKARALRWPTDASLFKTFEPDHVKNNVLTHRPRKPVKVGDIYDKTCTAAMEKAMESYLKWKDKRS
nr:AAA domain-containing protein [uncultured Ruminococcus sp.]